MDPLIEQTLNFLTKRRWSGVLLPLFALLNLAFVALLHGISAGLLLNLFVMAWLSIIPGVLILLLIQNVAKSQTSWLMAVSLGSAIGLCIAPTTFQLLGMFGAQSQTFAIVSVINLLLVALLVIRKGSLAKFAPTNFLTLWRVGWGAFLFATFFLQIYNFRNIFFDVHGNLVTHNLFGIDLPFLVSQCASLKTWSSIHDLNQLAEPMFYHDFTYIFVVVSSSVMKSELLEVLIYIQPIFGYGLVFISAYALVFSITSNRISAICGAASLFMLGSFVGTEQGSSAMSPSFVWGNILLLNILLVLQSILRREKKLFSDSICYGVLTVLLLILSRSKISTFAAIEGGIGVLILLQLWKREWNRAIRFGACWIIPILFFLILSQRASQYMPGGDFLVGAPLLGYANHLASTLHFSVLSINPVSKGLHFALRQILIIPYFAFHLGRFILMDGRVLIVVIAIIVFSNRLNRMIAPEHDSQFTTLLIAIIPIGFLIPVLYSPAWYPLALSFYTPLIGIEIAALLSVLILTQIILHHETNYRTPLLAIFTILLIGSFAGNWHSIVGENESANHVVSKDVIEGLRYLREHSTATDIIASHRYSLDSSDESYYYYSAFSERPVISEGSAYGVLLGALATRDSVKGLHPVEVAFDTLTARRAALDTIYLSHVEGHVLAALKRYNAHYLILDKSLHQTLSVDPQRFGDLFYDNTALTIFKVRQ